MKYIVTADGKGHYGNCSHCDERTHKATMEAGEYKGRPAIFCQSCVETFKRWMA